MMRAVSTIVLCGGFLASAAPPPVLAAAAPKGELRILVAIKDGETKAVTLNCDPDGGDHPTPRPACALMRKVKGDPAKLKVSSKPVCANEVQPHAVVVVGKWRGHVVKWGHNFANGCLMKAAGGAVFTL